MSEFTTTLHVSDTNPAVTTKRIEGLPVDVGVQGLIAERIVQPLSALVVRNAVTWVNPDMHCGEHTVFRTGKPTNLAVQVASQDSKRRPYRLVYARPYHDRSIILTRKADFADKQQNKYRYLDAKGTGNLEYMTRGVTNSADRHYTGYMKAVRGYADARNPSISWGAATKDWVETDIEMNNRLHQIGVRTVPLIAVADIFEVVDYDTGKLITIEEAKRKGYIAKKTQPVVLFRAWTTPFRLTEVSYTPEEDKVYDIIITEKDIKRKRAIVRLAIEDIQQDSSLPLDMRQSFSDIGCYLKWLANTIGSSLGNTHSQGITHRFLRALHNITLDGRFVDLDGMIEDSSQEIIIGDRDSLLNAEEYFYRGILSGIPKLFDIDIDPNELLEIATSAYYEKLKS